MSSLWNLPRWRPIGPQVVYPALRLMGPRLVISKLSLCDNEAAGNGSA